MKRVMKSKSGREIYGPKWQNNVEELSSCSNNSEAPQVTEPPLLTETNHSHISEASAQVSNATPPPPPPPPATEMDALVNEAQTRSSQGDCVAVELLLEGHPNLSCDEISEEGDRALHVAASMKHHQLVQKLVERMSPSDLALLDGRGYTACCYAAKVGAVQVAECMIQKNSILATARDREKSTPLQKAALRGKAKMVSYFLKSAKVEDLSTPEWFDILLATIRGKNYGVALEILEINEQLATKSNDEGTALHLLAGQLFSETMRLLAEKLWAGIQRLGESGAVELMKNPPILHNAARSGNMELITMLTQTYPQLIWHTDDKGHTFFHIAVKHRRENVFMLIDDMGATKDFIGESQDDNGNNILHLVGELPDPKSGTLWTPVLEMQRELLWFEKVKATVPLLCWEMKNKDGKTAGELFRKRHKKLVEASGTWMRNVADSCMLIATLIFTVTFGFSFAVPGGYDQNTGSPVLLGTGWFTFFVICECLAMLSSAIAILFFLKIMMDRMTETHFAWSIPKLFEWGVLALIYSLLAAVSVFISAFFLIHTKKRAAPAPVFIKSLAILSYVLICFFIAIRINGSKGILPETRFRKQTRYPLFKRPDLVTKKRRCWIF